MNEVVTQILAEAQQVDFILPKIKERHDLIAERARKWLAAKDNLLPVLQAFQVLGAHVSVDAVGTVDVRLSGNKDCFVKAWKLWRSCGIRLAPAAKGATEVAQYISPYDVFTWFHFSSTVCKRVKVGTKMVPQDIYETQCGTELNTIDIKELEGEAPLPGVLEGPAGTDDDIPF